MASSALNSTLWENYERFAQERGKLVVHILSGYINLVNALILDFGCGTGGVSIELAHRGANVAAFDTNKDKIALLQQTAKADELSINVLDNLPNETEQFDAIILLDVIEHLIHPQDVLVNLAHLLKPNGVVYISTPNKLSPVNLLIDPHFSLPLVSLLNRKNVKRVMADWLRWQPKNRMDFPELFSLKRLAHLLKKANLNWHFVNAQVVAYAFQHPESVWNRQSHLSIIRNVKKIGVFQALQKMMSDEINLFNIWLNPTWYIMAKKSPISSIETGLGKII